MPKYHKKIVFFKILICTGKTILWTTFSAKLKWCNKIVFTVNTYTWPNCLKRSLSREFWDNGFQKDTFGTVLFFMDGRSSGTTFFGLRGKCVPFISHFFYLTSEHWTFIWNAPIRDCYVTWIWQGVKNDERPFPR